MRHPIFFQDSTVVWRITFYSDDLKTAPVDPTSVAFRLESPSGTVVDVTPTNEPDTGKYSAMHVMNEYGLWDWHWQTETPRIVDQGIVEIVQRNVP